MLLTPYNCRRAGPGTLVAFCRVGKPGKQAVKNKRYSGVQYSESHTLADSQRRFSSYGKCYWCFSELESQLCILRCRALGAQHLRIGTQMGGHLAPMPLPPLQSDTSLWYLVLLWTKVLIPLFSQGMTQQIPQNSNSTNSFNS